MPVENVGDVLQASLAWQRARVEEAAARIAGANVPLPPQDAAADASGAAAPAFRLALEPGNPAADEHGIVRYPAVDLAAEMTAMMSATRAYEASVRAYNLLKAMNGSALEIGK